MLLRAALMEKHRMTYQALGKPHEQAIPRLTLPVSRIKLIWLTFWGKVQLWGIRDLVFLTHLKALLMQGSGYICRT